MQNLLALIWVYKQWHKICSYYHITAAEISDWLIGKGLARLEELNWPKVQ